MILPDEQKDDLQNGYYILQKKQGFRYGIDAVLLSDFAREKAGPAILDMGTGTGIIPILLAAKTRADQIRGLEIQPAFADMAARSVAMNHLENRVSITLGDIREAVSLFGTASFDT
ncbi:MAG: methyltransferase domain-containing protein, partial [Eubacterium sp.]|nr:methyltransferase domain-containing protein [Eubacterium sp.]